MPKKKTKGWGGRREGSGRKPKYGEPMVAKSFYLPKSMVLQIKKHSKVIGVSESEAVTDLLRRALSYQRRRNIG